MVNCKRFVIFNHFRKINSVRNFTNNIAKPKTRVIGSNKEFNLVQLIIYSNLLDR